MEHTTMNSEIIEALKMLGFHNFDQLPKLQEIRKEFFSCARRNHPDKNVNEDKKTKEDREEAFKNLLNAYNVVAELIIEEKSEDVEDDDEDVYETEDQGFEEIEFEKEEFKEVNLVSTNVQSVTIKIPTDHADSWKSVFEEQIGIIPCLLLMHLTLPTNC